jgi:hypothetical protein
MVEISSDFIRKAAQEPILSGLLGGVVVALGYSWRPFLATSVPHGTFFALTVTLVANAASYCFSKMKFNGVKNTLLSYSIGALVAVAGSVGLAYVGFLTSSVSLAGIIILIGIAIAAPKIFKNFPKPLEQLTLSPTNEQLTLKSTK